MESMILVLQKVRVALGIQLCDLGIAGTVLPVIVAGVALGMLTVRWS
jgi:hypothetical protein